MRSTSGLRDSPPRGPSQRAKSAEPPARGRLTELSAGAARAASRFRWPLIAIVAWAFVLWLPAAAVAGGREYTGFAILMTGWRATGLGIVAWYANPSFLISTVLYGMRRRRAAALVSALALVLALTSLVARPLATATGTTLPSFDFKVGFYLWVIVIGGFFLTCLGGLTARRKAETSANRHV